MNVEKIVQNDFMLAIALMLNLTVTCQHFFHIAFSHLFYAVSNLVVINGDTACM